MRKEIFLPIRYRRDGSAYLHKRHPIWSALGETVATALFIIIALLLLGLAMVQSSGIHAQEPPGPAAKSEVRPIGFTVIEEKIAHAELEGVGDAVRIEPATIPSLWPVRGRMSDGFGFRHNPFRKRSSEFHPGQDIAALKGTSVSVTADGVVVFAGCKRGYGRVVIVDHGNNISTRYGHLSLIKTTEGTSIRRGEEIGLVGSTGRSTGSHLHYEVRIGQVPVDPLTYLPTGSTLVSGRANEKPEYSPSVAGCELK